jgi:hypothetical protein
MHVLRWLMAWALAVVVTGALGSVIQTQFNLARIAGLGESVGLSTRLQTTGHDLVHFAPNYLIIVALGLLIALVVAGALVRRWPRQAGWLFPLAGFLAVATALGLMSAMLPVTVIGAARSAVGFLALCLAGALGGWLHWQTLLAGRTRRSMPDAESPR